MSIARNILVISIFSLPTICSAQCQNTVEQGCDVYKACFSKYCPCPDGPDEYFRSYGEKYCQIFLQNSNFGAAGRKWRDSTLRCLQEVIVPKLDISETPTCNCGSMKNFAFTSHVSCYTKTGASICDLPLADINEIRKSISLKDVFTKEGWAQMKEVASICATTAPEDGRRAVWQGLELILRSR